jgi:hypothetical protein
VARRLLTSLFRFGYCRDKEMHFKGVQKQNILQSFKEACSIHCLQESKQVTIVNLRFCCCTVQLSGVLNTVSEWYSNQC